MTDVAEPVAPEHTNGIHHPAAASGEKPDKSVPAPAEDAQPGLDGEESDEYEDIDPEDEHEEGAHAGGVAAEEEEEDEGEGEEEQASGGKGLTALLLGDPEAPEALAEEEEEGEGDDDDSEYAEEPETPTTKKRGIEEVVDDATAADEDAEGGRKKLRA